MFKNIMLPLDGSNFSELALPMALRVARNVGAHLHIVRVHVSTAAEAGACIATEYDDLLRDWEHDTLDIAITRAQHARVNASAALLDGPIVPALQQYIATSDVDLVIMTTHGRSGIRRAVLGSVAEQCVRNTAVPILLLRPRTDSEGVTVSADFTRILVPLDGTPESEAVLPSAVTIAHMTNAEIVLVRVAVAPFEVAITIGADALRQYANELRVQAENYLERVAARLPSSVRARCVAIAADGVVIGILKTARDQEADLIAMATHGRSGWVRVAVGSVAEAVLHRSTTPVLLIKSVTEPTSAAPRSEQSELAHSDG